MLETLDFVFHIGSTSNFFYFDLYLNTAYAAHYVYFIIWIEMKILFSWISYSIHLLGIIILCFLASNTDQKDLQKSLLLVKVYRDWNLKLYSTYSTVLYFLFVFNTAAASHCFLFFLLLFRIFYKTLLKIMKSNWFVIIFPVNFLFYSCFKPFSYFIITFIKFRRKVNKTGYILRESFFTNTSLFTYLLCT